MISLTDEKIAEIIERLERRGKKGEQKIKPKKIKAIKVNPANHSLPNMLIEVGKVCKSLEPDAPDEKVLAIFEATIFMVVTETRGLNDGLPYYFFRGDVRRVFEFD